MKVAFYTLGCKVNQYETEAMRECLAEKGYRSAEDGEQPDIIILNSCTVTAESDRKTRQTLRRLRSDNPNAVIVLTGCMVQAFPEKAKKLTEADIIIGNTEIKNIAEYVERCIADNEKIFKTVKHYRGECFDTPSLKNFAERTRAYMKIEDGCERYCTYCAIPSARGFVRSKPLAEIAAEAERLSLAGFSEIVLVGINLSAYGKGENINLCDAVEAVCKTDGIKRVRLGSLEPDHISDEMLERFSAQEKFCPQFHLSLQSGCDETLARMNRHYDTLFYKDLITRIRMKFSDAAITTDIMVGFPGETPDEFGKSLAFAKEIGFAKTHIFAYSRREGTVAGALPNQISNAQKAERSRLLNEVSVQSESEFLNSLIGKTVGVLFETAENGYAEGYTANYARVKVKSEISHTGELLGVKIVSAEKDHCLAEFV